MRGFAAKALPAGDGDDAAQEAMLRIFARASEFDPERDALAWILGVAAWQIRTLRTRRRRRREADVEELDGRASGARSPEEEAIASDLSAAIDRALAGLPRTDAETLLAYARGERPDLPGATFRKRVQRALVRLRAQWRLGHGDF